MTAPLAARRVLVIDDERAIAAAVSRRLEAAGALCVTAHDGAQAMALLAAEPFDLVVTDLDLPGATGYDVLEAAVALGDPPAVVLMAPPGDSHGPAAALIRGVDGYVRKPVDVEQLVVEAAGVLELRGLRQAVAAMGTARPVGPILVILGEIVGAWEKADPYRVGFSSRTARIAVALAAPLKLDADKLAMTARVHDVGMLAVPTVEQHSEGPLARPAQHLIRVHPTLGARWIERLGADRSMVAAVAAHHERHDGNGYPGKIAGAEIPAMARALGASAAIAAMCAPRPWRGRREADDVVAELEKGRGSQFGPAEADAAIAAIRANPLLIA
jgi:putative two-component system response regulator